MILRKKDKIHKNSSKNLDNKWISIHYYHNIIGMINNSKNKLNIIIKLTASYKIKFRE